MTSDCDNKILSIFLYLKFRSPTLTYNYRSQVILNDTDDANNSYVACQLPRTCLHQCCRHEQCQQPLDKQCDVMATAKHAF